MARPEWVKLCNAEDLAVEAGAIDVALSSGRRHRVLVQDNDATYELMSVVAKPAAVHELGDVPLRAWRRNRSAQLVGFRVDRRGRLVGEAWVPKHGLSEREFQAYVRRVAAECDRFEYLLTGRDAE